MDDQFRAVVKEQDDEFQQVAGLVRAEPQLPSGRSVVVQRVGDEVPLGGVDDVLVGGAVLAGRPVDLHPSNVIRNQLPVISARRPAAR
jgi:hypothetical protein